MAMYYCSVCGELVDDDWNPMGEHEECPRCQEEADDEKQTINETE